MQEKNVKFCKKNFYTNKFIDKFLLFAIVNLMIYIMPTIV